MPQSIQDIRNIGIVAHIDAGKTTTTERILYYTGTSHRMGNVDEGTTITDFDEEEATRGITIYSAAITCHWLDKTINIIDTPGHVDFTAEVERSLRVLDGAVVVFSAVEGVEAQSETVWRQADKYKVPRLCFINKMDRIGANFERVFSQISERLGANPLALQIPVGAGPSQNEGAFSGLVDLIEMQFLTFDSDSKGENIVRSEIPEEYREKAGKWHQKLLDTVALYDDELLELLIEESAVSTDMIRKVIRKATLAGEIQPTFCGCALDYVGVQPVLDAVVHFLPSPLDRPPIEGIHPNPKKNSTQIRKPEIAEPFCGLVFKIVADQHADLNYFRIYSGKVKSGTRLLNPRTGKKELLNQIWRVQADSREKVEGASVGDIVGVVGPKEVATGDTLCDPHQPIALESIVFPETVISVAVEPDSSADRQKLEHTLTRLARQDPTLSVKVSEETGQTILSGMGELHLQVVRHRIEKDFNLKIRVHKPRVSYRESVTTRTEAEATFHHKVGEELQFAKVRLAIEPFEGEESVTVVSHLKPADLPEAFHMALKANVKMSAQGGGLVGYPMIKVKLSILDVDYRSGETTEVALQAAAAEAMEKMFQTAEIVLLEPIMKVEVVTPEDFLGNIQSDLNVRRALIVNTMKHGDLTIVEVEAPLSKMFGYSTQIRSLSQGRASFSMEPLKYAPAPPEVLKDMLG